MVTVINTTIPQAEFSAAFGSDDFPKYVRSLSFPDMYTRLGDPAEKGTCAWLFNHRVYRNWLGKQGSLWIRGKPGSGKSTLLSYALTTISEKKTSKELVISFFFHGRGSELQRTPVGLYRSLLHQLRDVKGAHSTPLEAFRERCRIMGDPGTGWEWTENELQRYFEESLPKILSEYDLWLFIDALDECRRESAPGLIKQFQGMLSRLPRVSRKMRICFSCRHYPNLRLHPDRLEISVENENTDDITTFVHRGLRDYRKVNCSEITELISSRAAGVFMWARLVVQRVLDLDGDGESAAKIISEIKTIPGELEKLYFEFADDILNDPKTKLTAMKLICWICFAARPLSLDELRWALVINPTESRTLKGWEKHVEFTENQKDMASKLIALTRGLAEAVPSAESPTTVQFIHHSVKEFFMQRGFRELFKVESVVGTLPQQVVGGLEHYLLTRICLRYLAMDETAKSVSLQKDEIQDRFPFLDYAIKFAFWHAERSEHMGASLEDLLQEYLGWPSEKLAQRYVEIYHKIGSSGGDCPPEGSHMFHLVTRYRLKRPLEQLFELSRHTINATDSHGHTALSRALQRNDHSIIKDLLVHGANPNIKPLFSRLHSIGLAIWRKDKNQLERLLDHGADPDILCCPYDLPQWSAYDENATNRIAVLRWAAFLGNGKRDDFYTNAVELLLNHNANANLRTDCNVTVLAHLAFYNRHEMLAFMLETKANGACISETRPAKRVDPNARSFAGRTALWYASKFQHQRSVEVLLDHGAKPDLYDEEEGRTPLSWAIEYDCEAMAELLLLKYPADSEPKSKVTETPLVCAADKGALSITKLLLERGANPNSQKSLCGRLALSLAAEKGHFEVVECLLDNQADPKLFDSKYRLSPLSWAAMRGFVNIARLLLDRNATPHHKSSSNRTPLIYAAENGHVGVVRLLLERGSKTRERDNIRSRTAFLWAAAQGFTEVANSLFEGGHDLECRDRYGMTALWLAVKHGHKGMVQSLIDKGADVNSKHLHDLTPLWWAVAEAEEEMVRLLLKNRASCEVMDDRERTLLILAVQGRKEAIVRCLLDHGCINMQVKDSRGETCLTHAILQEDETLIKILLERGAQINNNWPP
ncbi:hypothetical protein HZ326_30933, partial [Fusarium oxysporum f. sp. albedinis]